MGATSTAGLLLRMRELSRNIEEEDESLQTLVQSVEAGIKRLGRSTSREQTSASSR